MASPFFNTYLLASYQRFQISSHLYAGCDRKGKTPTHVSLYTLIYMTFRHFTFGNLTHYLGSLLTDTLQNSRASFDRHHFPRKIADEGRSLLHPARHIQQSRAI